MTTRKNYNSVVFLTTLSVYLGLVLVGAPAHVLAQAALTGRIEAKDKIEKKDDLDKKPDDELQEVLDSGFIVSSISGLIEDLSKLNQIGKYEKNERFEIEYQFNRSEKLSEVKINKKELGGNRWSFLACEEPAYLIEHLFSQIPFANSFAFDKKLGKNVSDTKIKFFSENGDLELRLVSKQNSSKEGQNLVEFFNKLFKFGFDSQNTVKFEKFIYENTKATYENNQVIIVTRLPRGSLDALLVKDGAK